MDRRSWLWRRKSSEKSPGETESTGSISSPSERFSDDQAYSNHSAQSPEITSKAINGDTEHNDIVKTLKEKLSAALLNISLKEELAKQHAKVADEAVSGWEKAETEVLGLKQQLEALIQKNSALEGRVGYLDGALKECLRQLRQVKEEQDQKINEAVAQKTCEWEATKSEFENQLLELQTKLQANKFEAIPSIDPELCPKLNAAEKENSALLQALHSKSKQLEIMVMEKDLSTQAAETASKQVLDSIKKVAKLEAECRQLQAFARRAAFANDNKSYTASSVYVESFMDSHSDNSDRILSLETDISKISGSKPNEFMQNHLYSWPSTSTKEFGKLKNGNNVSNHLWVPSVEIDLMDDFIEMERLAALPGTESKIFLGSRALSDQPLHGEVPLKAELEAMISRTMELEEQLEKMELEKKKLEMALTKCQLQLKQSQESGDTAEMELVELQQKVTAADEARGITEAELVGTKEKLKISRYEKKDTEVKCLELQTQLAEADEARRVAQKECEDATLKLKTSTDQMEAIEMKLLQLQTQLTTITESKQVGEMKLDDCNAKKEAAELRLRVVESELNTMLSRNDFLETELKKVQNLSAESVSKYQKLDEDIQIIKRENELLKLVKEGSKANQEKELAFAASEFAECQKTIASLGRQLKSLATLEDFLVGSEKQLMVPIHGQQNPQNVVQSLKLHSSDSSSYLLEDS